MRNGCLIFVQEVSNFQGSVAVQLACVMFCLE